MKHVKRQADQKILCINRQTPVGKSASAVRRTPTAKCRSSLKRQTQTNLHNERAEGHVRDVGEGGGGAPVGRAGGAGGGQSLDRHGLQDSALNGKIPYSGSSKKRHCVPASQPDHRAEAPSVPSRRALLIANRGKTAGNCRRSLANRLPMSSVDRQPPVNCKLPPNASGSLCARKTDPLRTIAPRPTDRPPPRGPLRQSAFRPSETRPLRRFGQGTGRYGRSRHTPSRSVRRAGGLPPRPPTHARWCGGPE